LNGNLASFSWSAPSEGGQTGYLLHPLGELGGASLPIVLPASATTATYSMGGPTCFVLFTLQGNLLRGNTDIVCAFLGFGNISSQASSPTQTTTLVSLSPVGM
jgi:hypothetical protein